MAESERVSPEALGLVAERRLFVEGKDEFSFDPHVLGELVGRYGVDVRPVGGADNVMAAVHALTWAEGAPDESAACPQCFSAIDRDFRPDGEVEATWAGGPFSSGRHLIWRRHEFESYFLEPEFVSQARWFRGNLGELAGVLEAEAQRRVCYDAANLVAKQLRHRFRFWNLPELKWTGTAYADADSAETSLLGAHDWQGVAQEKDEVLSETWLRETFRRNLEMLVGGPDPSALQVGQGEWLLRMAGSSLIGCVLSERFFAVPGSDGTFLAGKPLWREVARDLMRRFDELSYRPQDLVEVRDYFRDTRPSRFPSTDTAASPPSP